MLAFFFCTNNGTLTFTFTTPKHASGNYVSDGRYVLAAWIETNSGTFVKTKIRNVGGNTDDHLPTWGTAAGCTYPTAVLSGGCNITDATTGATLTTFTAKTFTWDGKNVNGTSNGTVVADGTYRVAVQETWGHGASTATRYFTFTKGAAIDSQTPANDTNFTNITLKWVPTALATSEVTKNVVKIVPNPATNDFKVEGVNVKAINIYDVAGRQVQSFEKNSDSYNISKLNPGVYYVEIINDGKTITQKLEKK